MTTTKISTSNSDSILEVLSQEEQKIDLKVLHHLKHDDYTKKLKRFQYTVLAVYEIVNKKLYRSKSASLELYFRDVWKISRAQVYRFLDCAAVLKQLDGFQKLPCRERLCRSLKRATKSRAELRLLWARVLERVAPDEPITSTTIESVWKDLLKSGAVANLNPECEIAPSMLRRGSHASNLEARTSQSSNGISPSITQASVPESQLQDPKPAVSENPMANLTDSGPPHPGASVDCSADSDTSVSTGSESSKAKRTSKTHPSSNSVGSHGHPSPALCDNMSTLPAYGSTELDSRRITRSTSISAATLRKLSFQMTEQSLEPRKRMHPAVHPKLKDTNERMSTHASSAAAFKQTNSQGPVDIHISDTQSSKPAASTGSFSSSLQRTVMSRARSTSTTTTNMTVASMLASDKEQSQQPPTWLWLSSAPDLVEQQKRLRRHLSPELVSEIQSLSRLLDSLHTRGLTLRSSGPQSASDQHNGCDARSLSSRNIHVFPMDWEIVPLSNSRESDSQVAASVWPVPLTAQSSAANQATTLKTLCQSPQSEHQQTQQPDLVNSRRRSSRQTEAPQSSPIPLNLSKNTSENPSKPTAPQIKLTNPTNSVPDSRPASSAHTRLSVATLPARPKRSKSVNSTNLTKKRRASSRSTSSNTPTPTTIHSDTSRYDDPTNTTFVNDKRQLQPIIPEKQYETNPQVQYDSINPTPQSHEPHPQHGHFSFWGQDPPGYFPYIYDASLHGLHSPQIHPSAMQQFPPTEAGWPPPQMQSQNPATMHHSPIHSQPMVYHPSIFPYYHEQPPYTIMYENPYIHIIPTTVPAPSILINTHSDPAIIDAPYHQENSYTQ